MRQCLSLYIVISQISLKLTFLSAGGVVGGGVIARGEGSVALRAAAWEQTNDYFYFTAIQLG